MTLESEWTRYKMNRSATFGGKAIPLACSLLLWLPDSECGRTWMNNFNGINSRNERDGGATASNTVAEEEENEDCDTRISYSAQNIADANGVTFYCCETFSPFHSRRKPNWLFDIRCLRRAWRFQTENNNRRFSVCRDNCAALNNRQLGR